MLDDRSIENPGMPPYYTAEFFSTIKHVHAHSALNVAKMTEKQWYRFLLEQKVTMVQAGADVRQELIPCRAELKDPEIAWVSIWPSIRLPGLGSGITSFIFKVLHNLLPTQERISRTSPAVTGMCRLCVLDTTEDLHHALVSCPGNGGVGHAVLQCLPNVPGPNDTIVQIVAEGVDEYPVVWFMAVSWMNIWESRRQGKRPELFRIRADLEAKVSLLRKTRYLEPAEEISQMISKLDNVN